MAAAAFWSCGTACLFTASWKFWKEACKRNKNDRRQLLSAQSRRSGIKENSRANFGGFQLQDSGDSNLNSDQGLLSHGLCTLQQSLQLGLQGLPPLNRLAACCHMQLASMLPCVCGKRPQSPHSLPHNSQFDMPLNCYLN